jgi:ABC-type multidrug transport system fused ATPase/permease subunit
MCLVSTVRYFILLKANLNASRYLFDRMFGAVISVPLAWFDTVPIGRIINRFTADFQSIDSNLGKNLGSATSGVLQIFGIVLAATLALPAMFLPALALLAVSVAVCYRYLKAAREMKRLEAVARSPVLDLLLSVTEGLATIRGFDRVACYVDKMHQAVDRRTRALWHLSLFNAWLSFRLNMIGATFATLAALLIVRTGNLDASVAGFALSFVLQFSAATDFALRRYASLELDMNALERVLEFTQVETEAETETGGIVPATWPTQGLVQVCNITARYKPTGPDVLRNVSLTLQPGQRVGIIGRTGASKSSLILTLFRLLRLSAGSILVDGIDISTIHPRILRSRLAIVPQDPMLFSGTIRYNLDPDDQFDDSELLDLLRSVWHSTSQLQSSRPNGYDDNLSFDAPIPSLDTPVSHGVQISPKASASSSISFALSSSGRKFSFSTRPLPLLTCILMSTFGAFFIQNTSVDIWEAWR